MELDGQRVFVTGASGFIGRRLVTALAGAGAAVTVLARGRAGLADLPAGVVGVKGDLADTAAMTRALAGQAVLFNLAYDVRATAAANVAAFDQLCAAAAAAGVGRIVHLSSIVVYDAWPDGDCTEAGAIDSPAGSAYRRAKIAMEHKLAAGPLPAAILQPTIVYGPGSALWTDGFARALLAGGVVLPEPEGLCNGVFVDDVAQACLAAARLRDLGRERFIVSGPSPFPWSDLLEGYARILGRGELRRVPVAELLARLGPKPDEGADLPPTAAARISAVARRILGHRRFEALAGRARKSVGPDGLMWPSHHLLEEFSGRGTCRIDHARERLGFTPSFDLDRGLAACAPHLRTLAR